MTREEDLIRSTTQAIASTVREVPPLRLEPVPGERLSAGRAARATAVAGHVTGPPGPRR